MKTTLDDYKKIFKAQEQQLLDDYFTFLRFPSISANPSYRGDLKACAKWLETILKESGFTLELWNTEDAPILLASNMQAGPDKPTLLLYNHYDVQPVDPIELWRHDPFNPHKEGNNIYARGAQDNKGQCFYVLTALRLYLQQNGKFPINIKWIIEGEEESGSTALSKILPEKKQELSSDYTMIVDLGIRKPNLPAITLGTRGLCSLEIEVQGTNTDLHSGMHGGLARNPIHVLVELLAQLRDDAGKILVPGFYDNIATLSKEAHAKIDLKFDSEAYKAQFGQFPTGGEIAFSPIERVWLRPTLEINGIGGGYQGPGGKTVIPAKAFAKITCRLVPHQEPETIANSIKNYLESQAPQGVTVSITIHEGKGKPVRTKVDSPINISLEKACKEVFGNEPEYILEGASIPIVSEFTELLAGDIAMFGLGLPSDNIHATNEHFGWDRIEQGYLTICKTIDNLAG